MTSTLIDRVCSCVHWEEEHAPSGECCSPGCDCVHFTVDPELNTVEAIADRGGFHQEPCHCPLCANDLKVYGERICR